MITVNICRTPVLLLWAMRLVVEHVVVCFSDGADEAIVNVASFSLNNRISETLKPSKVGLFYTRGINNKVSTQCESCCSRFIMAWIFQEESFDNVLLALQPHPFQHSVISKRFAENYPMPPHCTNVCLLYNYKLFNLPDVFPLIYSVLEHQEPFYCFLLYWTFHRYSLRWRPIVC